MPSAEGSVSVPNVMPLVPINSDMFDEQRLPGVSAAAAQLLPLYHARGYYGPTNTEIEEEEFEVPDDEYIPSAFPSTPLPPSRPKRVKIIKINEPRKKIVKKGKPKRGPVRKPVPAVIEGEHPVSTFHEQFYSDIDGSGTIRKIRKPPRVEKIIDGDTEHIHTYSEEHIHKMQYDDGNKIASVIGVDPLTGMSAIGGAQQIIPLKNGHTLVAVPANSFGSLAPIGLGGPQFEYAAYNPREVTHDHIFHDHGEIPADVEINKESLGLPPKVSYNTQGLRISGGVARPKPKSPLKPKKPAKPVIPTDFSYYEGIYAPVTKPKKSRNKLNVNGYDPADDIDLSNFRPVPDLGYRDKRTKSRNPLGVYFGKTGNDFRSQQSNNPAPFSVSSTVVHDYKPNSYTGAGATSASLGKHKDSFGNYKNSYTNNFDYDSYSPGSNLYTSEDKNDVGFETQQKRGKKKSISTQNISFGNQDHISIVDHLNNVRDETNPEPTALDNIDQFDDQSETNIDILNPSSPAHQYYSAMAAKAFQDPLAIPEASNDNFEYVEAPISSTTPFTPSVATTETTPESTYVIEIKPRPKDTHKTNMELENQNMERHKDTQAVSNEFRYSAGHSPERLRSHDQDTSTVRGKLKYGDKI
ncbi:uncharacterized protein LOC121739344 [Aricia agestis]|uniref:uncharacterized protein LOC121739344 n=1 Tax=Aricia agestis TaxID=91739 RepID=UPI001C209209|nr:uncharacterized protein LOC121739344 [Aricia agestis]